MYTTNAMIAVPSTILFIPTAVEKEIPKTFVIKSKGMDISFVIIRSIIMRIIT